MSVAGYFLCKNSDGDEENMSGDGVGMGMNVHPRVNL